MVRPLFCAAKVRAKDYRKIAMMIQKYCNPKCNWIAILLKWFRKKNLS